MVILPGIPPPVIIESSEFLRCVTVLDHHMSVVEFERHETIDKVCQNFLNYQTVVLKWYQD